MIEKDVSDDEAMPGIPSELYEESKKAVNDLLSNKSKAVYEMSYDRFIKWQQEKHTKSFSERILLIYFSTLAKKYKSSTLWSEYSKIAKMVHIRHNVDVGKYRELKTFLKKLSVGYRPKKSKTLTWENIEKFLNEAPDFTYLAAKVAMIFGVLGACHKDVLIKIETTHLRTYFEPNDPIKKKPILLVHIPDTKTHQKREFAIKGNFYNYYQRYSDLRPENTPHNRFFINYQKGKCTVQPIGEKRFAIMPKDIAQFLKLPNPESYTGHAFRQSPKILLAEGAADTTALKSKTVAEDYVKYSLLIKKKTSNKIINSIWLNVSSSNHGTMLTENPAKREHLDLPLSLNHDTTLTKNPVKIEHLDLPSTLESFTSKENSNPSIELAALNKNINLNISNCLIIFTVLDKK